MSIPSIIQEMENFINRTKQISAFIFEANSNSAVIRPSPRTWRKGLDFKRLSYTSWDEVETAAMQRISLPKGPFKVELHPCESQPSSSRISWQVSPCMKIPGKTRKCKVVQNLGSRISRRTFSANIMCVDDKILVWGNLKDENEEGEDFELFLTVSSDRFDTCSYGGHLISLEGGLKRGMRKKDTTFVTTHDAFILS